MGQPPRLVEAYDDKALVCESSKNHGGFTVAKSTTLTASDNLPNMINAHDLEYPLVAKPVRGRGSYRVKVSKDEQTLKAHAQSLFKESPGIIVEQYLDGEEATVSVMSSSTSKPEGY